MENIIFVQGGLAMLPLIEPLWNKLRVHHLDGSIEFRHAYDHQTFTGRARALMAEAEQGIRVELAKDETSDNFVGYCVCSINKAGVGEIASLYIEEYFRQTGIGDYLMKSALEWLDHNQVRGKRIVVAAGNETALDFYRRYGFCRRATLLEQITDIDPAE